MKKSFLIVIFLLLLGSLPAQAQDGKTYLPLVTGGSADNKTQTILPCTDAEMAALNQANDQPMPDNPSDAGCLLPTETFAGDMHSLIFDDDDRQVIQPSTSDYWTWPRKVSLYRLDCSSSGCSAGNQFYIEGVLGLFPARSSTIPVGGSWNDYFVSNWASIGPVGYQQCPGGGASIRPHVLVGIGQGRFSSNYYSTTPKIYAEHYDNQSCYVTVVTGYNPSSSDIHHLQIYQNSISGLNTWWTARYWRNNQWYYIWTNTAFTFPGYYMMVGGEVGATTLAKTINPIVELQYISKLRLKLHSSIGWKSYHETNIYYLSNATTKQADSPITMLDWNTGLNFTSMAWEMNQ